MKSMKTLEYFLDLKLDFPTPQIDYECPETKTAQFFGGTIKYYFVSFHATFSFGFGALGEGFRRSVYQILRALGPPSVKLVYVRPSLEVRPLVAPRPYILPRLQTPECPQPCRRNVPSRWL